MTAAHALSMGPERMIHDAKLAAADLQEIVQSMKDTQRTAQSLVGGQEGRIREQHRISVVGKEVITHHQGRLDALQGPMRRDIQTL